MTEPQKSLSDIQADPKEVLAARDKLSAALAAKKKEFEEQEALLKDKIGRLEAWLQNYLVNVVKADSARFGNKTVTRVRDVDVQIKDWHAYHNFIMEKGQPTLLQKRAAKTELLKVIEERDGELPPGVHLSHNYKLQIRTSK